MKQRQNETEIETEMQREAETETEIETETQKDQLPMGGRKKTIVMLYMYVNSVFFQLVSFNWTKLVYTW